MTKKILSISVMIIVGLSLWIPSAEASTQSDVVSIAKNYIGVPYKWGGTSSSGFDCSGFVQYVFKKAGIDLPRTSGQQFQVGKPVSQSQLSQGDIVFFHTYKSGPSHVGIYVGDGKFIQASSDGVMISLVNGPYYWGARYYGAKRVIPPQTNENNNVTKQDNKAQLPSYRYYDVPKGSWFYDDVTSLSKNNIINGVGNHQFKPGDTVTRTQAAAMLSRIFHLDTSVDTSSFQDVPSNFWGAKYIEAVKNKGLMKGTGSDQFDPNAPITRKQIAILFNRAFTLKRKVNKVNFNDVSTNNAYYQDIENLAMAGITKGFPNHTFRPNTSASRAQFSAFLYRATH